MKAVCWEGVKKVRVEEVPDPQIIQPHDAIVKVSSTAICGSDIHLYDGFVPTLKSGDILGHEFMGEVVEVGPEVKDLRVGDRVVVPFTISCGQCFFCRKELFSLCDNTNPHTKMAELAVGYPTAGIYGYSKLYGGYAGGQAEYVRVPFADSGPVKIENDLPDEKLLFLSDILPTGYQAAENCEIQPGDTVAVWGCGPVGLFAIRSAWLLGAERVIAIDRYPERLDLAASDGKTEVINYEEVESVPETLRKMTADRGPDSCIDAVGLEAHGHTADAIYDKVKTSLMMSTDRIHALREAVRSCRKGGIVSVPGVYAGFPDKFPMGAIFAKSLKIRTGQTHVQKYLRPLLQKIEAGALDPSFIISHEISLDEAAEGYQTFVEKQDECVKVVMKPHG